MKTYFIACLGCLCCLPAASQVAPLRPRYVQVDTATYDATRTYLQRADSTIKAAGTYIGELQQQNRMLAAREQNRATELLRSRQVNADLTNDNQQLNERLQKALALPLQKPFLLDPHTAIGGLVGGLLVLGGFVYFTH